MKKIALSTILLLLVLITAVAFVSCDRAPSNTTTPTTEPTTEPTTDPNGGNNGEPFVESEKTVDGIVYLKKSATSYWVKDASAYTGKTLEIPAQIDGIPVTVIGASAFQDNTAITAVSIPDGVIYISNAAFKGCSALRSVTFGKNSALEEIYPEAFMGCINMISFTIPSKVTQIYTSAFLDCHKLVEVNNLSKLTLKEGTAEHGHVASYLITNKRSTMSSEIITQGDFVFYKHSYMKEVEKDDGSTSKVPTTDRYLIAYTGTATNLVLPTSMVDPADSKEYSYAVYPYAFYGNTAITEVTVPTGAASIGKYAFAGCNAIAEMTIPYVGSNNGDFHLGFIFGALASSLNGDYVPESLKTINVTDTTRIAYRGFYNLKHVTTINLPDTLREIGTDVFSGCTGLTEINLPAGLVSIESQAFRYCTGLTTINLPAQVTKLATRVFEGCTNLTTINFPAGITEIEAEAFRDCTALQSFNIPAGVTVIADRLFSGCTNLVTVTLPTQITSIGAGAFNGCEKLGTLALPATVAKVGAGAFNGCTALLSVEGGVSYVGKWAVACDPATANVTLRNDTVGIAASAFNGCSALVTISIPNTVAYIGDSAFYNCAKLTSVTIPNGVTAIEDNTFYGCSELKTVSVPASVQSFGSKAFYNCKKLEAITIPAGVTTIKAETFYGCAKLKNVAIPASVTLIEANAFQACNQLISVTFENTENWICVDKEILTSGTAMDVTNAMTNASNLAGARSQFRTKFWKVVIPEAAPEETPAT